MTSLNCRQKCLKKLKQQDIWFGESFSQKIDNDSSVLQSYMGSIVSILLLTVTLGYAYQKMDILANKKDVTITSTTLPFHFEETSGFTYENGLNLAVAFTSFNNEPEWELDPAYGTLRFNAYSWSVD